MVVLVSVPVMRANSAAELRLVHAVNPPPAAISWLVTTVFWLGSTGVIVVLAILGPLVPEITGWIAGLKVPVAGIARAPRQVWGVEKLAGQDATGRAIELSVYGPDASDARVLRAPERPRMT
jgi:hypothetical protein